MNLDALDAGTKAHEDTVKRFRKHLAEMGIVAQRPSRGAPLFDLGWEDGKRLFIGEVKSLRSTNQDQQIRLGIGQILDYAHKLDARHSKLTPVLILERKPADARWTGLTRTHGILLTHRPNFVGV